MSNPTMNHNSHLQEVADQQQQQKSSPRPPSPPLLSSQDQEQFNQVPSSINLNSDMPTTMTLMRSDSTSTVILEEEEKRVPPPHRKDLLTLPPSALAKFSFFLRSLSKTSGLFNEKPGSFDKLNDLFASGDEFTLQRLLSEVGNEIPFDMNDLFKFDSVKMLDSRTLSDFIRSESFDQLLSSAIQNNEISSTPPALPCSSSSFSELRPVSPELLTPDMFAGQNNKMDTTNPMIYTQTTSTESSNASSETNQTTLNAVEHDHAFLYKRMPIEEESPSSSSSVVTKTSRRIPNRPTTSSTKSKRSRNVNRAKDIQSSDDLSYYLERRRKNNEASKVSRAVRKQKFDEMDRKCAEYERLNEELRKKISTLETVTKNLKSGLITNFQRK